MASNAAFTRELQLLFARADKAAHQAWVTLETAGPALPNSARCFVTPSCASAADRAEQHPIAPDISSYAFLERLFVAKPERGPRDFYVAGESCGGSRAPATYSIHNISHRDSSHADPSISAWT